MSIIEFPRLGRFADPVSESSISKKHPWRVDRSDPLPTPKPAPPIKVDSTKYGRFPTPDSLMEELGSRPARPLPMPEHLREALDNLNHLSPQQRRQVEDDLALWQAASLHRAPK